MQSLKRAANNFPAGAGQIVWSNLFLLGHIPFLAGQTSITSYCYKSTPSPLHMMFKYETSKFSKHLLYTSIDLNAGKVERMVQQNQYHICAYYYCLSSTSYIRLVMKLTGQNLFLTGHCPLTGRYLQPWSYNIYLLLAQIHHFSSRGRWWLCGVLCLCHLFLGITFLLK